MPNKLREGRRDECAPCTHCMTCFVAPYDFGVPMYCRVNPAVSRAYTPDMPEGYDPLPAEKPRTVMVVGGGPAGMEAARIAAQRGHRVALYEKNPELGGLMDLLACIKGSHEKVAAHKEWLVNQLALYGVEANTGQEITAEFVAGEAPDTVVVATGGAASLPAIPGIESAQLALYGVEANTGQEITAEFVAGEAPDTVVVATGGAASLPAIPGIESADPVTVSSLQAAQIAGEPVVFGDRVAIVGAQFQACALALSLVRQGKTVTMLNPGPQGEFFMNAPTWPRMMGKKWLLSKGMCLFHNCAFESVEPGSITFQTEYGTTNTLAFDTLVVATPLASDRALFEGLFHNCAFESVEPGSITFQTEYGTTNTLAFDTLVVATPLASDRALFEEIGTVCADTYAVGDCYSPSTIANATARANIVARRIGNAPEQAAETPQVEGAEVFSATALGIGDVTVSVGVTDGAIVDAAVDTSQETAGIGRDLGEGFAQAIVETGGVDAVSGATVTSTAVQTALAECLAQAGLA